MDKRTLTTAAGVPVADNQNAITAGAQGPVLLQDVHLLEKLQHFNRERIPERVVHAKGSGAYGYFVVTADISRYTRASLFAALGKRTEVFARFSTVGGEKGSADTERDPRGFAVKFYTDEGIWDLTGNNTPVFFIRDPGKFPDFIHTQKRDPQTNLKSPAMMWDFWSRSPEALHQITILFSDRGIPDGYRHMDGFGSHTFSLVNAVGERTWCKWHFKTRQGIRNLANADALRLAGEDPDYSQRDLYKAIATGAHPRWRVCLQIMPEQDAAKVGSIAFDVTKVWSHKRYPLIEVGEMVLDRNPDNYFADVEQAAFSPGNVPPGLGVSPDRMLQGRLFAYHDAHLYRVGTNYQQLPVNRPRSPVHDYQRDGAMRFDGNAGSAPNYEPNRYADAPKEAPHHREPPLALSGNADRYDHRAGNDDFAQAGDLYRLMSAAQQSLLVGNIAGSLRQAPVELQRVQVEHFARADPGYGAGVAAALGLTESGRQASG